MLSTPTSVDTHHFTTTSDSGGQGPRGILIHVDATASPNSGYTVHS